MISGGSAGFSTMMALPLAAPPTTSMAFDVVSVNSSMLARVPGPALLLEMLSDDLAVVHLRHARDRRHHRDGGLAAAGDHVDVGRVEVRFAVDHRDAVRTDGRRREVDHADRRLEAAQQGVVA